MKTKKLFVSNWNERNSVPQLFKEHGVQLGTSVEDELSRVVDRGRATEGRMVDVFEITIKNVGTYKYSPEPHFKKVSKK